MIRFIAAGFVLLAFVGCGPKIDAAQVATDLAHKMCGRMGACAVQEGSAFGMDICVTGLTQAYTMSLGMQKKTSVDQDKYTACATAIDNLACAHAQMSFWPDACQFMQR